MEGPASSVDRLRKNVSAPGSDFSGAKHFSLSLGHGVEKCYARNAGLQYHVDLHLEVDPHMTVWKSHELATTVRFAIREKLDWVADVLVHVEPSPTAVASEGSSTTH